MVEGCPSIRVMAYGIEGVSISLDCAFPSDLRLAFRPCRGHDFRALFAAGIELFHQALVAVAITYGDPAFYGKVGFLPLDEDTAASPLPLSFPAGWIGQSLTNEPLHPLKGDSICITALNEPAIW
jgi:hypothetical protein